MGSLPLLEMDSYNSDTLSEGTTASRCSSLTQIRLPEGYVKEKFRVDRRKLEAMIYRCPHEPWDIEVMNIPISSDGRVMSVEEFFQKIMTATGTEIKYPKYLDNRAKNKKDPHVHIMGLPNNVSAAVLMVRNELQPQCKVTLKMDVGWTHHSHIIGKGGNNIQAVVKKTGVSIHFPDGNKNSETHKCNQVSINSRGKDLNSLEEARSAVREQTPLIFTFELPATAQFVVSALNESLLINKIQSTYNVQVEIHKSYNDSTAMLRGSVRGIEWDASRVKEATLSVLKSLCGSLCCQMPVEMVIDISVQHHAFVLGCSKENIRNISQMTSTLILFPDQANPTIRALDRSKVVIRGAVESVYRAYQNILGSLPLVLMFDLPAEQVIDQNEINQVMQSLDVFILARSKQHSDGRKSIIIKGGEKYATSIYEAWHQLSKSTKSLPKAKVPRTYFGSEYIPMTNCIENTFTNEINTKTFSTTTVPTVCDFVDRKESSFPYTNVEEKVYLTQAEHNGEDLNILSEADLNEIRHVMGNLPDKRAPGYEKSMRSAQDFYFKKMQAIKAINQVVTSEPRTPTDKWSGYGFSKTSMPSLSLVDKVDEDIKRGWDNWKTPYDIKTTPGSNNGDKMSASEWPGLNSCFRNVIGSVLQTNPYCDISTQTDLNELLVCLQLEQYIDLFAAQDIDFKIFITLTEEELKGLGISIFGHRKKLLFAAKNWTSKNILF